MRDLVVFVGADGRELERTDEAGLLGPEPSEEVLPLLRVAAPGS